jgi:hypothetical protein
MREIVDWGFGIADLRGPASTVTIGSALIPLTLTLSQPGEGTWKQSHYSF